MKQWSKPEVADALKYTAFYDTNCKHHQIFSDWVSQEYKNKKVTIFDIGCGNCNVVNYFSENYKYIGIDINNAAIDFAEKHKKDNVTVFMQDIEEEITQEVEEAMDSCQVCYIDSVFTMIEDPKKVLQEILLPKFDFIFLGRTSFSSQETVKASHKWPGMDKPSTLWKFDKGFFRDAAGPFSCTFVGNAAEQAANLSRVILSNKHNDLTAWITSG